MAHGGALPSMGEVLGCGVYGPSIDMYTPHPNCAKIDLSHLGRGSPIELAEDRWVGSKKCRVKSHDHATPASGGHMTKAHTVVSWLLTRGQTR